MSLLFSTAAKNAGQIKFEEALEARLAIANGGALQYWNATSTPTADGAITGTLLAELQLSAVAFTVSGGTATANTISDDESIDATGVANYVRVVDSSGNPVVGGDLGLTGSGATFEVADAAFTQNLKAACSSLYFTLPVWN
jgi:hypothetical protein